MIDPRIIFITALKANASYIILAHNHPSGNLKPIYADDRMTTQLMEGGKLLGIDVADHLIITNDGFYSFSNGLTYEKVCENDVIQLEALLPF